MICDYIALLNIYIMIAIKNIYEITIKDIFDYLPM